MTEKITCIEFLLKHMIGSECHCDVFRNVPSMKPATSERRLREWRQLFVGEYHPEDLWIYGYKSIGHVWKFQRPFIAFLRQQVKAAYRAENAKVKNAK